MSTKTAKWLLSITAAFVFTFAFQGELQAQRGFRIGNVFAAGGGQGFRLGGPRAGMHFGGGQGATIGGQYYGMRFGNGQGARIGGQYYGMQFGGGQGSQIGRFANYSTPNAPGSYYYGNRGRYQQQRVVVYPRNNYYRQTPVCYQQQYQLRMIAPQQQHAIAQQNTMPQVPGQIVNIPAPVAATPAAIPNATQTQTQTSLELAPAQAPILNDPALGIVPTIPQTPTTETLEPVSDELPVADEFEESFLNPELEAPETAPAPNSILNKDLRVDDPIDSDSLSPGFGNDNSGE